MGLGFDEESDGDGGWKRIEFGLWEIAAWKAAKGLDYKGIQDTESDLSTDINSEKVSKIIKFNSKYSKESTVNALSSDFYSIIPHNFGIKQPTMINHLLRIKEKVRMLDVLSHI